MSRSKSRSRAPPEEEKQEKQEEEFSVSRGKREAMEEYIRMLLTVISAVGVAGIQVASFFFRVDLQASQDMCHKTLLDVVVQQGIRVYLFFFSVLIILVELQWKNTFVTQQTLLFFNKKVRGICHVFVALVVIDQKVIFHFHSRALTFRGVIFGCLLMACGVWYITQGMSENKSADDVSVIKANIIDTTEEVVVSALHRPRKTTRTVLHVTESDRIAPPSRPSQVHIQEVEEQSMHEEENLHLHDIVEPQAKEEKDDVFTEEGKDDEKELAKTLEASVLRKTEVIKSIDGLDASLSSSSSISGPTHIPSCSKTSVFRTSDMLEKIHKHNHLYDNNDHNKKQLFDVPTKIPPAHFPLMPPSAFYNVRNTHRPLILARTSTNIIDSDDDSDYDDDYQHSNETPTQVLLRSRVATQIENIKNLVEMTVEGAINRAELRFLELELVLQKGVQAKGHKINATGKSSFSSTTGSAMSSRMQNVQNMVELLVEGATNRAEMRVEQMMLNHKNDMLAQENRSSQSNMHNEGSLDATVSLIEQQHEKASLNHLKDGEKMRVDRNSGSNNMIKGDVSDNTSRNVVSSVDSDISNKNICPSPPLPISEQAMRSSNITTTTTNNNNNNRGSSSSAKTSLKDSETLAPPPISKEQTLQIQQKEALALLATMKSGWLHKCGHVRKNWSKRWFVLEKGVLRYYKAPLSEAPYGKGLKGEIHLDHFLATMVATSDARASSSSSSSSSSMVRKTSGDVVGMDAGRFNIYNTLEYNSQQNASRRTNLFRKEEHFLLEIKADTNDCALEWIAAINGHIEYFFKSKFDDLLVEDILSEGWLEKKNTLTKKWHKRWFVLKANKIEYFDDEKCNKSLGEMHLHADVRLMSRDGFTHLFKFAIWSKNNRMEVSAPSEQDRQNWITMINKVCKKGDDSYSGGGQGEGGELRASVPRLTEVDFKESNINIYANVSSIIMDDDSNQSISESVGNTVKSNLEANGSTNGHQSTHVSASSSVNNTSSTANTNATTNLDGTFDNTMHKLDHANDDDLPVTRARVLTLDMINMLSAKDQERQNLTLEVLRKQLRAKGELPLEFIPLDELQGEVASIFEKVNKGEAFDEDRLDYLLHCLELNPEHKAKLELEKEQWRAEVLPYTAQCFQEMRGFIPSHIFDASIISLVDDDGLSKVLAKRFFMKKCLMLIRLVKEDISKMHIAELSGRFNPTAQGLDIVELAAIYYALPDAFLNDHDGKKEQWKNTIQDSFQKLYAQKVSGTLPTNLVRFKGYVNETPFFQDDDKYHSFSKASSATDDSANFLKLSKQKSDKNIQQNEKRNGNDKDKVSSIRPSLLDEIQKKTVSNDQSKIHSIGKLDMQKELQFALKKRNTISVGGGGGGGAIALQDELKNSLKRRSERNKQVD